MDKPKALSILRRQLERAEKVTGVESPEYEEWRRTTEVILREVFPKKDHVVRFQNIDFRSYALSVGEPPPPDPREFEEGMASATALLRSCIDEVETLWPEEPRAPDQESWFTDCLLILRRFHLVARQLSVRRAGQPPLEMTDEYDVQYLLGAILKIRFDDVRPEEYTPSRAGSAARMDFLLKEHKAVVEAKMASAGHLAKQIGEELTLDIEKYRAHPDCRTLICFVYDPAGRLVNSAELTDLNRDMPIRVEVVVGQG